MRKGILTLISLDNGILGNGSAVDRITLDLEDRGLAWSPHLFPEEPEQLPGQQPASRKDGPFGRGRKD